MKRYFIMKRHWCPLYLTVTAFFFMLAFSTGICFAGDSAAAKAPSGVLVHQVAASRAEDPFDGISFPTIYKSGVDLCTNTDGKPVVLLFSSFACFHCEWVGEIFDTIAMKYMEEGLIEAHHYDKPTGDDLLTEEIETVIPEQILEIYQRGNPKDLVPYINFSCKYERVGNGYEKTQDTEAEGQEMMAVIDTLIRVLSASENKRK